MALSGLEGIMTMCPRPFFLQTVVFGSYVRCMMHDPPLVMCPRPFFLQTVVFGSYGRCMMHDPPLAVTVTQYQCRLRHNLSAHPFNRLVGFISSR